MLRARRYELHVVRDQWEEKFQWSKCIKLRGWRYWNDASCNCSRLALRHLAIRGNARFLIENFHRWNCLKLVKYRWLSSFSSSKFRGFINFLRLEEWTRTSVTRLQILCSKIFRLMRLTRENLSSKIKTAYLERFMIADFIMKLSFIQILVYDI